MQDFSVHTAGFAALTLSEILLQECLMKGVLTEEEVRRVLTAAARRHEDAASGDAERVDMNMEAARLIRHMQSGLVPLFERLAEQQAHQKATAEQKRKKAKKKKRKAAKRRAKSGLETGKAG
ncbi:hypothetical protein [Sneathiella chinensis]|uniref:Uncharacterized protein n=1 Tax=Sneathiella chinensis TaxID=349750 RepID=A0ABQ5U5P9_9PROT|nr:hypothetical protein [Sneathiella chinensis]GLQ06505.1 hypothetical protein GCM10007924_17260 [Sneathiella chinensis]